jgi:ABC-type hemin transport system ATPase subunit
VAAVSTVIFQVEGLGPDGQWHLLDQPLGTAGDHAAHRDAVIRTLRDLNIDRYSRVRLVKYVTTSEVVGQEIEV